MSEATQEISPVDAYASLETERVVLASTLGDPNAFGLAGGLPVDAFSDPRHAAVWEAITAVARRGETVGVALVQEELRRMRRANTVVQFTGPLYQLAGDCVSIAQLADAVSTLRSLREARALVRACQRSILRAQDGRLSPTELRTEVLRDVGEATRETGIGDAVAMSQAVIEWYETFEVDPGQRKRLARFGIHSVDNAIGDGFGLVPGSLYVLAARPGSGKTSLAADAMLATAREGGRVLFFSLEMQRTEILTRLIASTSGVDSRAISRKQLTQEQSNEVTRAADALHALPFWINDRAGLPISEIRAKALAENAKGQLALVVIDHLNIVAFEPGSKNQSEVQHLSNATGIAKRLAKELSCPVLLLVQLNRGAEQRDNAHRPRMRDLRGSGSIEQDADVVMFIYREALYDNQLTDDHADIDFAKQRNAPTCTVEVGWNGPTTSFYERPAQSYQGDTHIPPVPKRGRNLRVVNGEGDDAE